MYSCFSLSVSEKDWDLPSDGLVHLLVLKVMPFLMTSTIQFQSLPKWYVNHLGYMGNGVLADDHLIQLAYCHTVL